MKVADLMSTLRHVPDFAAVTPEEKAQGYSSRCAVCGRRLFAGCELIASACPGPEAEGC